jgi:hypothetical protein
LARLGEVVCAKSEDAAAATKATPKNRQAQVPGFMFASRQIHPTAVDLILTTISHFPAHHDCTPNTLSRAWRGEAS